MNNIWEKVSTALLTLKNIALVIVGISLTAALVAESLEIVRIVYEMFKHKADYTHLIEEIIVFFLYFEFIALIVKYFKNKFHFPLRYFLYIGITAIIRLIIVNHEETSKILVWSTAILVLVISLAITEKYIKRN